MPSASSRRSSRAPSRLRYADEGAAGITRRKVRGGKWGYWDADGARITDRDEIDRLNAIALPPAYEQAWFSPDPDAHILATGVDARGRKQYRYHADWRAKRDARKFDRCAAFGLALPKLRKRVEADLALSGLCHDRAVASVVVLLDTGAIRVGNEAYAKANKSFGATTLRGRHAKLSGRTLRLRFRGKGGKLHEIASHDRKLIACVKGMQDLSGQHLFQYLDEEGGPCPVCSHDVNAYVHETMGEEFSAKDFRTFAASRIAFETLSAEPAIAVGRLMERVAQRLGNTPAIARKSYVHPALVARAKGVEPVPVLPERLPRKTQWLSREERGLIAFLESAPGAESWAGQL
jgi:DNA topoisomerase I